MGINSGTAIVSQSEGENRMAFTAVGEAVNQAALVLREAQKRGISILASSNAVDSLHDSYPIQKIGELETDDEEDPVLFDLYQIG